MSNSRSTTCLTFSVAIVSALTLATPARAAPLSGADDPAFSAAVSLWLDDNDRDSLSILSALAVDGNRAARLLLARIEGTDRAPSTFVSTLPRAERLDIYRSPKTDSPFRTSWLRIESEAGNPYGDALLDSGALGISLDVIDKLNALGELQAAEHLIRKTGTDGTHDQRATVLRKIGMDHELAPYVHAFLTMHQGMTTGLSALMFIAPDKSESQTLHDSDTKSAARFADIGYQAGEEAVSYRRSNVYYGDIANWVMTASNAAPIAQICRDNCLDDQIADCANTAFGLVGGYYEAIRFDSPLEAVIPQEQFQTSKRAKGMALRKIAAFRTEQGTAVFTDVELHNRSQCLASAVLKQRGSAP